MPRAFVDTSRDVPEPKVPKLPQETVQRLVQAHAQQVAQQRLMDMDQRIGAFPNQMVRDAPVTVASLVSSGASTNDVVALGGHMHTLWPWLKERNSSSDAPGSGDLLAPRILAQMANERDVAQRANDWIDEANRNGIQAANQAHPESMPELLDTLHRQWATIQTSPGTPPAVLGELGGQGPQTPREMGMPVPTKTFQVGDVKVGAILQPGQESATVETPWAGKMPQFAQEYQHIQSDTVKPWEAQAAMNEYAGQVWSSLPKAGKDFYEAMQRLRQMGVPESAIEIHSTTQGAAGGQVAMIGSLSQAALTPITSLLGMGFDAAAHLASGIVGSTSGIPVLGAIGRATGDVLGAGVAGGKFALGAAFTPFQKAGEVVTGMAGISRDDPAYSDISGGIGGLLAMGTAHLIGDVTAGARAAGRELPATPEALRRMYGPVQGSIYEIARIARRTNGDVASMIEKSRVGRTAMRRGWAAIKEIADPTKRAGALLQSYREAGMNEPLAARLAKSESLAEFRNNYIDYHTQLREGYDAETGQPLRIRDAQNLGAIVDKLQQIEEGSLQVSPDELAHFRATRSVLESRISSPAPSPLKEIPRSSWVQRVVGENPTGPFGRIASFLYNPRTARSVLLKHTPFRLASIFREVPDRIVYNALKESAPANARELSGQNIRFGLGSAGASPEVIQEMLGRNASYATQDEYFRFRNDYLKAELDGLKKAWRGRVPPEVERQYNILSGDPAGRNYGWMEVPGADGSPSYEPVLYKNKAEPNGNIVKDPQPFANAHMAGDLRLPGLDALNEGFLLRRRLVAALEKRFPRAMKVAMGKRQYRQTFLPYGRYSFLADVATMTLKPLLLLGKLPFSILMRSGLDQEMRNWLDPEQRGTGGLAAARRLLPERLRKGPLEAPAARRAREAGFEELPSGKFKNFNPAEQKLMRQIGLVFPETFVEGPRVMDKFLHERTFNDDNTLREGVIPSLTDLIQRMHNSSDMRALAKLGPREWASWWANTDAGREYLKNVGGVFDAEGKFTGEIKTSPTDTFKLSEVAARAYEFLDQHTGRNPAVMQAIADGYWTRDIRGEKKLADLSKGGFRVHQLARKERWAEDVERYQFLTRERDGYLRMLEEAKRTPPERLDTEWQRATRAHLNLVESERSDLSRRLQIPEETQYRGNDISRLGQVIRVEGTTEMNEALQREFDEGMLNLPSKVQFLDPNATDPRFVKEGRDFSQWGYDFFQSLQTGLFWPLRLHTKFDLRVTRGLTYMGMEDSFFQRYKSLGWPEDIAKKWAQVEASKYSAGLHYDLLRRSSTDLALKNTVWFGPLFKQFMKTWLVDIPRKYYWPAGVGVIAGQVGALYGILKAEHVIQKDPQTGKEVVVLPWVREALIKVWGYAHGRDVQVPEWMRNAEFDPMSVNMGLSGLAIQVNNPMAKIALEHVPFLKKFGGFFNKINDGHLILPRAWNYLWEAAFGKPMGIERFGHSYLENQWNLSMVRALRAVQGQVEPMPSYDSFIQQKKYQEPGNPEVLNLQGQQALAQAYGRWKDHMNTQAYDIATGDMFSRSMGLSMWIAPFLPQDKAQTRYNVWYNRTITKPGLNDPFEISRLKAEWASKHPEMALYTIPETNYASGKKLTLKEWQHFYETKPGFIRTPEQYLDYAAARSTRAFLNAQLQTQLDNQGITNWSKALTSGFQYKSDFQRYFNEWEQYKLTNPGGVKAYEKVKAQYQGTHPDSFWQEQLLQAMHTLWSTYAHSNDPKFKQDVTKAYQDLAKQLGHFGVSSKPFGKIAQGILWYHRNVQSPFYKAQDPLYNELNALPTGADASAVYTKIRDLQWAWWGKTQAMRHQGIAVPYPEEVSFANKDPVSQRQQILHWASLPLEYLGPFQLSKVKVEPTGDVWKFLTEANSIRSQIAQVEATPGLSSTQLHKLSELQSAAVLQASIPYGPAVQDLAQRDLQPPYARIPTVWPAVQGNQNWTQIARTADGFNQALQSAQLSPRGDTGRTLAAKIEFFSSIDQLTQGDSGLQRIFDQLGVGLASPSKGEAEVSGWDLYNRLFFGDYSNVARYESAA